MFIYLVIFIDIFIYIFIHKVIFIVPFIDIFIDTLFEEIHHTSEESRESGDMRPEGRPDQLWEGGQAECGAGYAPNFPNLNSYSARLCSASGGCEFNRRTPEA